MFWAAGRLERASGRALEEKRKRTVSEREEEDDGTLVRPLPVEHSADDMQAAKKVKRES